MTKVIVLEKKNITPRPDLVRQWLDESHYHTLITEDTDIYAPPNCHSSLEVVMDDCNTACNSCSKGLTERNIIFKFRKNFFTKEEQESGYNGLHKCATATDNRGNASGVINEPYHVGRARVSINDWRVLELLGYISGMNRDDIISEIETLLSETPKEYRAELWVRGKVAKFQDSYPFNMKEWFATAKTLPLKELKQEAKKVKGLISNTSYANYVYSGICGWYDRYPRFPYGRATSYTATKFNTFKQSYPFLERLSVGFKELLPWRHNNQSIAANSIDEKYVIPNTPFTTVTVNKNFRTSAHYDPANMPDGFANLVVLSNNDNYSGCYLVFPEIGYAVDIRPGDLLLVDNQAGLHGNTEIVLHDDTAERVSIIAFFHEGMLKLGTYEYEETRKAFLDIRINDTSHPMWKKGWTGVTEGCFADIESKNGDYSAAKDWYDYLLTQEKGEEWLERYHPHLKKHFSSKKLNEGLSGLFS